MRRYKKLFLLASSLAFFILAKNSYAHPGRTAADGCHYCRTNCDKWGVPWNTRHCHGGPIILPATPKPIITPTIKPTPHPTLLPAKTPTLNVQGATTSGPSLESQFLLLIFLGLPIWIIYKYRGVIKKRLSEKNEDDLNP